MVEPPVVFITRRVPDGVAALLRDGLPGVEVRVNREDRNLSRAEIIRAAKDCHAMICTLADPVDRIMLEALSPGLRVVATFAVGYDNIDLAAAKDLGIAVTHTPGVLTDATAEIAVGLILACARRFVEGDALVRRGDFRGWAPLLHRGVSVYGKVLGIVGPGRIGRRVAETMRHGFGCEILYCSRSVHADWENELQARRVELAELLESSDFVSLHCPLTPQTHHLIDSSALKRMKSTACLINTARGPVVDEAALVEALKDGELAGAGFDVYENEPALAPGLSALPNTVLLPHIGSATFETRDQMGRICARAVVAVLNGNEPEHRLI